MEKRTRGKDHVWEIPLECTWEQAQIAVLQDLRDELKAQNRSLREITFELASLSRFLRRRERKRHSFTF